MAAEPAAVDQNAAMAAMMQRELAKAKVEMKAEQDKQLAAERAKIQAQGGAAGVIQCSGKSLRAWIMLIFAALVFLVGLTCKTGALEPCKSEGTTAAVFIIAVRGEHTASC